MQHDIDQHWSSIYDQGRDFNPATAEEVDKPLTFVDSGVPKTALDIGCGTGQLVRELHRRGFATVGVDASTSAIRIAKSWEPGAHRGLSYKRMDFERDNLSRLPHQPYGLITCKLVYAFIYDKPAFLGRVKQLLAPHGVFVVVTPQPDTVPPEKARIIAGQSDMELLPLAFDEIARYEQCGFLYFIGMRPDAQ